MTSIYSTLQEPTRNASVSVSTTSVTVADARQFQDQPRKVITIRNISAAATSIISISLGNTTASANTGIVLRQYESFTDAADGAYVPWQGTINAICADANGTLAIFER